MASKPEPATEPSVAKLAALAADLHSIANALVAQANVRSNVATERARVAKRALDDRASRVTHLPARLFGEPGWDILLDLFVEEDRGRLISVSSAAIASGAPPTTASRWIDELSQLGLIERRPHPADGRSTYIALTEEGRRAMSSWADDELSRELAIKR